MMPMPLQNSGVCSLQEWALSDWHPCVFEPVPAVTGDPLFGLLVGAGMWLAFYMGGSGRMEPPTVLVILMAGIMLPTLPGGLIGVGYGVLTIGVAAAAMQVLQKYVLNPSTT